ncbi:hypothetical protein ACQUW5_14285 [Legionella sp. CNM-1927-20]|uniref:hypothetical protein n=1 Tax=Legionella sp. CNM-1927-20 TaxID=3422221 RepID=UPI00403B2078
MIFVIEQIEGVMALSTQIFPGLFPSITDITTGKLGVFLKKEIICDEFLIGSLIIGLLILHVNDCPG